MKDTSFAPIVAQNRYRVLPARYLHIGVRYRRDRHGRRVPFRRTRRGQRSTR